MTMRENSGSYTVGENSIVVKRSQLEGLTYRITKVNTAFLFYERLDHLQTFSQPGARYFNCYGPLGRSAPKRLRPVMFASLNQREHKLQREEPISLSVVVEQRLASRLKKSPKGVLSAPDGAPGRTKAGAPTWHASSTG